MRIVLFCSQTKGVLALDELLKSDHEIAGVVTHPAHCLRGMNRVWSDSVEDLCLSLAMPMKLAWRAEDHHLLTWLSELNADVFALCNWRTILNERALAIPNRFCINVHEGLLPKYAGLSPVLWAIVNGEKEVGVTTHQAVSEVDAGPILRQCRIAVPDDVSAGELLRDIIYPLMASELRASLDEIETGSFSLRNQDLSQRHVYRARTEEDNLVNWECEAREIHNLIRAQSDPYPNAFGLIAGRATQFRRSKVLEQSSHRSSVGSILAIDPAGIQIACGRSTIILITEATIEGHKISAGHWSSRIFKPKE